MSTRYVSRRDIAAMTGLGRTAVAALTSRPDFPIPVRLNARVLRYPLSEVEAYLTNARSAGHGPRRSFPVASAPEDDLNLMFITGAA